MMTQYQQNIQNIKEGQWHFEARSVTEQPLLYKSKVKYEPGPSGASTPINCVRVAKPNDIGDCFDIDIVKNEF
jgi:hypothetical protein